MLSYSNLVFFALFVFESGFLCPGTHFINQDDLEVTEICLPLSAFWVLGLEVCMPHLALSYHSLGVVCFLTKDRKRMDWDGK